MKKVIQLGAICLMTLNNLAKPWIPGSSLTLGPRMTKVGKEYGPRVLRLPHPLQPESHDDKETDFPTLFGPRMTKRNQSVISLFVILDAEGDPGSRREPQGRE